MLFESLFAAKFERADEAGGAVPTSAALIDNLQDLRFVYLTANGQVKVSKVANKLILQQTTKYYTGYTNQSSSIHHFILNVI